MRYRYKLPQLNTLGYIIFFFAMIENRFTVYQPILVTVYLLRIAIAFKGYYLAVRSIKVSGSARSTWLKLLLLQLAYSLVIVLSGVMNHNITFGICYSIFIWIGITQFIVNSGINNPSFLKTLDGMFQCTMVITLILTVLVPDLMITYSYDGSRIVEGFFGGKNALPLFLLTGLCLNLMLGEGQKKYIWRQLFYPLICLLLLVVSGSGTGLVAAMIFLILYYTKLYTFLNTNNIFITHTIVTFSIVVYRLHERYLYFLITDVLHRDITLTYRTDIWTIAIKGFLHNWFLGYGLGNRIVAENLVLPSWYQLVINEAHNGFVDIALGLGLMGLIPLLLLLIIITRAYDKSENMRIARIMKLYLFVYFIIAIAENAFTLSRLTFWSMLFIGLVLSQAGETKGDLKEKRKGEPPV